MKLSRMKVELRNEHYLDSLGAGTTDKVRQAELSYNVAQLEYEQLQQQYKNEKEVAAAELKVQELDFNIFRKSLSEKKRTLMMRKSVLRAKLFLPILITRLVRRFPKADKSLSFPI